jgi:hypothetical protein
MQQIIFIIILSTLLSQAGYAQNQAVTKIMIPEKAGINLLKTTATQTSYQTVSRTVYSEVPVKVSLLHFNDQPVLKLNKNARKPFMLFTKLSFSDVLENSMNGIKIDLLNTYDSHIPELFKNAPSLFKVKCIFPL